MPMLENLKTALLVLNYLPQLIDLLELAIPQAKQGAAAAWPMIERAIAAIVAVRKTAQVAARAGSG